MSIPWRKPCQILKHDMWRMINSTGTKFIWNPFKLHFKSRSQHLDIFWWKREWHICLIHMCKNFLCHVLKVSLVSLTLNWWHHQWYVATYDWSMPQQDDLITSPWWRGYIWTCCALLSNNCMFLTNLYNVDVTILYGRIY